MGEKPRFDAMQAVKVVDRLATDPAESEAVLKDWKGFLETNFSLTEDQQAWLAAVDPAQDAHVRQILSETINSAGRLRLVVAMIADHAKPGGLYHELRQEAVEERPAGLRNNLVIARCDANCQNWKWF